MKKIKSKISQYRKFFKNNSLHCSDPKKLDKNTVMLLMRIESCIEQGSVLLVCF